MIAKLCKLGFKGLKKIILTGAIFNEDKLLKIQIYKFTRLLMHPNSF